MRVVLVVPVFPQLSETFIVSKALGLLERGWDIQIVCSASTQPQWSAFGAEHPVHRLRERVHITLPTRQAQAGPAFAREVGHLAFHHRQALGRYVRRARASRRAVVRGLFLDGALISLEPDVAHFEFGATVLGRTNLRSLLDCAVTVSFRGSDLNVIGLDAPGYFDEVWQNADGIHVLGASLVRQAHERGARAETRLTVIHPAIDLSAISRSEDRRACAGSTRPLRIISVGRLHWTKGYDYALEAVADLRRRGVDVQMRIVGDGDLLEAVAFWRHQLDLDGVVELVGPATPSQVAAHCQWADVMLHAAVTEGFGNAVIEAQAQGLPVVCSDAGGLPENVEDGVTGFVVPRRDPTALADALERLALGPALRQRMGAAGRERVGRLFRFEDHLDAWECFYEDAVATRGAGV